MTKKIIVDAKFDSETRVAVYKNGSIVDLEYENNLKKAIRGNLYLAKIVRIEPALQAAFVDYGGNRGGFLPFDEIHPSYYNIPTSDKQELMKAISEIKNDEHNDVKNIEGSRISLNDDDIDLAKIEEFVDQNTSQDIDIEESEIDDARYKKYFESAINKKGYNIQEVIKTGQIILVQVIKEERGNKGALLSSYVSLSGRYCVLMPNTSGQNGISRKISNSDERRRLQEIVKNITENASKKSTANLSLIMRTVGMGRSGNEILKDYQYLINLWNKIRKITLESKAPSFIYEQDNIIRRFIRDNIDDSIQEFIIQGTASYNNAKEFVEEIAPEYSKKVKQYKGKRPIFSDQGIEKDIADLYKPTAPLPSGGYIVINPTEALISIDVNSGKSTSEKNIEETALKINLESAKEIARQVRLRELSGIIVIDFIDMQDPRNRKIIERSLREFLKKDRAKIHIAPISKFGLLEMSRQRLMPSFSEYHSTMCTHCSGKGIVRGNESNAMLMLRTIEDEIVKYKVRAGKVSVFAHQNAILHILNNNKEDIKSIEDSYKVTLDFQIDKDAAGDLFSIEIPRINNIRKNIMADFSKFEQLTNKEQANKQK